MSNLQQQPTNRSLTGVVTKLVGDGATYGFINDEIFFPQTNVSGGPASVGDQVFAECEYSAHMPIKWNATSVKIINKAAAQQQTSSSNQQQELVNQQQFNQTNSNVAVTYQQHRQQRQQRQLMDIKQEDNIINQEQQQQQQHNIEQNQQSRLLDQQQQHHHSMNNPSDIFGPPNTRPNFPMQQQPPDSGIQPFHDQPMGPPNFTYTSQLGSAFVQNQFLPTPFLPQQPPPMLPQHQQQPPQHLLSSNQPINQQQQQQRHDQHNKGMGGRFNNHGGDNKNDRQNNRRNRNDNNKFDRPRSSDRDSNRQAKNNSGERSTGRATKRDDIPVRPSPPPHSSAKSTTSISSDKAKNRRHYEIQNLPKIQIMTNMNAYNMKQRCPSSVHVPSDLKNVIVNSHFRLDLKNTPKPILFRIELKKDSKLVDSPIAVSKQVSNTVAEGLEDDEQMTNLEKIEDSIDSVKKDSKSSQEQIVTPASKSDIKLNHKYGVKVLLISIPDFETIYHSVFGDKLDSFNVEGKNSYKKLDELITLLCNKGSNNGYSLIGGKFDPNSDGFVEGETNDLERHGRKPDLIATCKRVVIESVGLDLSNCRSWTLLSTFMYNNKSDYFSPKASIEYSYIYMPELWSLLTNKFDSKALDSVLPIQSQQQPDSLEVSKTINTQEEASPKSVSETIELNQTEESLIDTAEPNIGDSIETTETAPNKVVDAFDNDTLNDMKVTDLKIELDKRNVKYKAGIKKAELIALLQDHLKSNEQKVLEINTTLELTEKQDESKMNQDEHSTNTPQFEEERQLEEGEVLPGPSETNSPDNLDEFDDEIFDGKRKASDLDISLKETTKKLCSGSGNKKKHVDLIKESFTVYSTPDQQLSLVPLNEAIQAGRYDQFELSVSSNILKESIIQHFSEYILTTLVEDHKQKISTSSSGQNLSSQDTNSDTNNNSTTKSSNNNNNNNITSIKNSADSNKKEYSIGRYINLAFTYFDSSHTGHVYFEDLNKLFNNTGLTISKRALMALIGEGDKFNYKALPDLSPKLSPTYVYKFPIQFIQLPGSVSSSLSHSITSKLVEHKGVVYDVEKLIQQVKDAETLSVSLVDRFNYAIENSDKQIEEIHVLEVSQKSLSKAIKAQNEEINDLKKERDSVKKKYESVRKGIKGAVSSLNDLIKE